MDSMPKNVFVIDDDPDILELISYNLGVRGYRVKAAPSGIQALWEIANGSPPDLIFLDLMMPSPDGFELCRYLKTTEPFADVPLIVVSARSSPADIERAFSVGADAFLPKPFSIAELMRVLAIAEASSSFSPIVT